MFSAKGYVSTRLEDIAKEAGVSRGAVYWHYGNKFRLYQELLKECYSHIEERVKAIVTSEESPLTRIRRFILEFFVSIEEDEEYRAIEEITSYKTEISKEFEPIVTELLKWMKETRRTLAALIQKGIEVGEIDPRVDPQAAAIALVSFVNGVEEVWLMDTTAFSPKKDAVKLIDIFLKGIAKP